MNGIYVEVDRADLNLVMKKLGDMSQAPRHLKNAINRTATKAKKTLASSAQNAYTIKGAKFNSDIKIQRATTTFLDATLKASGRPRTVMSFKHSMPKSGGRVDITKSGLKPLKTETQGAAFMFKGLMAQRTNRKERGPIRVAVSNSVPKMIEKVWKGERGMGDLQDTVRQQLHDEIMEEIKRIM